MSENALVQIKRKEIELQTLLLEARRDAEGIVAAAREESVRLRLGGKAAAEAEARQLREAELARARREAEAIREEYQARVRALDRGEALLPVLAEQIVSAVAS